LSAGPLADIEGFLARHEQKELVRFTTVGSVDDGKSTLIGRLLHDTGSVFDDQLRAVRKASVGRVEEEIDFSLFTDGLLAEREQGITIDVAYRYFSTETRKFIIADTPGHEQYTRNMATGASTADIAIILLDARLGVLPQSRRHATIASLLGISQLVVAVNKMDLVDFARRASTSSRPSSPPSPPSSTSTASRSSRCPRSAGTTSSRPATAPPGTAGRRCSACSRRSRCDAPGPTSRSASPSSRWSARTSTTAASPASSPAASCARATRSWCSPRAARPAWPRSTRSKARSPTRPRRSASPCASRDEVDVSRGEMLAARERPAGRLVRRHRDAGVALRARLRSSPQAPAQAHLPLGASARRGDRGPSLPRDARARAHHRDPDERHRGGEAAHDEADLHRPVR
jgi:small GTP-binding protein